MTARPILALNMNLGAGKNNSTMAARAALIPISHRSDALVTPIAIPRSITWPFLVSKRKHLGPQTLSIRESVLYRKKFSAEQWAENLLLFLSPWLVHPKRKSAN
jgi:hypothetical protein